MSGDKEKIPEDRDIRTEGGAYTEGPVDTGSGDFVGRDQIKVSQVVVNLFAGATELLRLCSALGVSYADLSGDTDTDRAQELIARLQQAGRLDDLVAAGRQLRPDVAWDRALSRHRERPRTVNLRPVDVTHTFQDREREINALCEYLSCDRVRLISIVGRAGMGKTALACRVLGDLERGALSIPGRDRELAADGILYLSARSTGLSLDRIYTDVGRMLDEPAATRLSERWASEETSLVAKVEHLVESMQGGLYLIFLDNLENALKQENTIREEGLRLFVEGCLIRPTGARLIATSQAQVNVADAGLPGVRTILLSEGLPEQESVSLLRELDPQATLRLRDAPQGDLQRAAQSTSGIPRALETLAGILRRDPTASLNELLDDETLFGERVVEQLVAESYRRLGESERRVMEALAVFDLPVAAKAIGYLLEPWFPDLDPRRCLPRLVASYFVSTTPPKREFNLRSLDRDYVYRQLPGDAGESDYGRRNLELRAADFYASARKPENEWRTIGDLAPQLREFEHRIRAEDHDGAYQVLAPIGRDYLYKWGHWSQLADMHAKLRGKPMSPQSQAANSGNMGRVCRALGQTTLAVELYKEALDYARQTRDRKRESVVLGSLGNAYLELWQFGQAIPSFLEALAIAGQAEDREQEGRHLGNLGLAYYLQGRVEQAIGHFEDALDIARETSNPVSEGGRLGNLGKAYLSLGQIPLATHRLEEALTIALETGNRRQEGVELCNLGMVRQALGQPQRAILLYEQALDIAREIGYRAGEERYLSSLASAYRDTGQIQEAEDYYRDALAIAREIDDYRGRSYQLLGMAQLSLAKGLFQDARAYCEQALTPDVPETSYRVALTLGIAYLCQHDRDAGNAFHDAAIRSQAMLDKTADLYKARYALAAARVGQAVCDQRWTKASDRPDLLASVLDEYRSALNNCSAKGAVQDARRDLELIEKAGIDGLEPVFELLEEHIGD